MSFITSKHHKPYAAILPSRSELSQSGQTVLITGGGSGIGYAISKAFAQAAAATVVIVGRRPDVLKDATVRLKQDVPEFAGRVLGLRCDVSDVQSTEELWNTLQSEHITVDVLVLNAADSRSSGPLHQIDLQQIWAEFNANVRGPIDFAQRFLKQNDAKPNGHRKVYNAVTADGAGLTMLQALISISTLCVYDFATPGTKPNYNLTKNAGTLAMQQIARDIPVEKTQIVSFHPGGVFTEASKAAGFTVDMWDWDDGEFLVLGISDTIGCSFLTEMLPGSFAVWAASDEAKFLHGRYVEANWDVEELCQGEVRAKVEQDQSFLQIGVNGLVGVRST
jgi:NAD(P)-dependent dehydrogenase (short-subunit alcohol dehydrogenase family)